MTDLLAIVPARGGSVGIRRKNLRIVNGRTLVLAKLESLRSAGIGRVVCSTNDPLVASISRMAGFDVHERSADTSHPVATIAHVVEEVVKDLEWTGPVGVFQCTSPGLTSERIREEVDNFLQDDSLYSACSVTPVHDVCWGADGSRYGEYINRQFSEPSMWRETGGIRLLKDPSQLPEMVNMAGHHLIELNDKEALDIDDYAELAAAKQNGIQTDLVFMVICGKSYGSGHIHRCLTLADELSHHRILFRLFCEDDNRVYWDQLVANAGYEVLEGDLPPQSTLIFDSLGVDPASVYQLKNQGHKVVCLEDDGPGAALADLVINELLPTGHYCGPDYAVLRPEFLTDKLHDSIVTPPRGWPDNYKVLIYFGGTDPMNMSSRAYSVAASCRLVSGITNRTGSTGEEKVTLAEDMASHDLLVTSQGRAVFAAAHIGIPTISIPVNTRELNHVRLDTAHYLPRAELVTDDQIFNAIQSHLNSVPLRKEMSERGQYIVDGKGTQRVARLIDNLCEGL